jgi:hypothetical protein
MIQKIYPGNRGRVSNDENIKDQLALDNCSTAPHPEMIRTAHDDDACHDDWGLDV